MAADEPQIDPELAQLLYGGSGASLGFPDHWFAPPGDSQLAIDQGAAPPGVAGGLPPTAAVGPPPSPGDDEAPPEARGPDASSSVPVMQPGGVPQMHPADLAAQGIAYGPPEPTHLPYGIDLPPLGPGAAPPPPPGPPTIADMPDITIRQEPPGGPAGVSAIGGPMGGMPSALPGAAVPFTPHQFGPQVPPAEQHYQDTIKQYAGHIDQIPDPAERMRAYKDLYSDPNRIGDAAEYEARAAADVEAHNRGVESRRVDLLKQYQEANQKAVEDWQASTKATEAKMTQVQADVDRLANTKINPSDALNPFQKVAGVIMGLVGGLYQGRMGMANNIGLDALNGIINRNIAEQKGNLERQMQGAQGKLSLLGQEYSRHGDMYRAEQTMRMASYQVADQLLAVEQQNYTPGGTTERTIAKYRAGALAQAQKARIDLNGVVQKQEIERRDQVRKEQDTLSQMAERKANTAHAYAETTKAYAEAKKLGVETDELNPAHFTNPTFTVPIGENNPFTGEPVMGKYPVIGKDREKHEQEVRAQISTYGHVQDYWQKLQAIGDKIGNAKKSMGESVWKARRGTYESEYDAAKEALTVYLTKEVGDKPTQGQLMAQAHRIPERASVFEARDPGAQIQAAQEDADRDFSRDMTQAGIDYEPIVRAAQARRAIARPTPDAEADAARGALGQNPADKDAQRDLMNAQDRQKSAIREQQQRRLDISDARQLQGGSAPLPEYDAAKDFAAARLGAGDFDPKSDYGKQELAHEADINAAIQDANRAAKHYEALRDKFQDTDSDKHLKGLTLPGDIAAANRAHDVKLGGSAADLLAAHQQAIEAQAKAQSLLQQKGKQRAWEQQMFAGPDAEAPPPPDPALLLPAMPPIRPWWVHPPHTQLENR